MIEWAQTAAAKAGPVPLVFLLGAGASFGAIDVSPYPPPLGPNLYDRLAKEFPNTWGRFAYRAEEFRRDFEMAMEHCLGDKPAGAIFELNDMARYFAQFDPGGSDLYSDLLRALEVRALIARSVFCTLNYECMFEKAAHRLGHRVHYEGVDSAPIVPGDVRVMKPHGSCNFLTRGSGRSPMPQLMAGAMVEAGIEVEDPERVGETLAVLRAEPTSTRTRWVVMSNYASDKTTPLSPAQITQVRVGFSARVDSAARMIVIGARPNDHDDHVWGPLRGCSAEVLYVGGNYSDLRVSRPRFLGPTFEEAWTPLLRELDAIAERSPPS